MGYFDALKAQWATLPSTDTTAQKLAAINAAMVPGPNADVTPSSIVAYLALNLKLATLLSYAKAPPQTEAGLAAAELAAVLSMGSNAPTFATSQPSVYSTLQGMLNALASDQNTGITATDVTNLLALASTTIPWSVANGYGPPPLDMKIVTDAGLS